MRSSCWTSTLHHWRSSSKTSSMKRTSLSPPQLQQPPQVPPPQSLSQFVLPIPSTPWQKHHLWRHHQHLWQPSILHAPPTITSPPAQPPASPFWPIAFQLLLFSFFSSLSTFDSFPFFAERFFVYNISMLHLFVRQDQGSLLEDPFPVGTIVLVSRTYITEVSMSLTSQRFQQHTCSGTCY